MKLAKKSPVIRFTTGLILLLLAACSPQSPAPEDSTAPRATAEEVKTFQTAQGSGVITEIGPEANRVVIDHQPIAALNWPQMTMGFELSDPTLLRGLEVGQSVNFELQAEGMNATITQMSRVD